MRARWVEHVGEKWTHGRPVRLTETIGDLRQGAQGRGQRHEMQGGSHGQHREEQAGAVS